MRSRSLIAAGVAAMLSGGAALLNKVNGFERNLRTGRYTRTASDRAHSTTFHKTNGAKERARRMRQIERGQLTASNGLVRGAQFPKVDSHGRVARDR
jgi:hypothetical protein